MALFQISEPGEAEAAHPRKRAIGIDLGTTNSLVATVRNGLAVVLPDAEGRPLVPSIVRYGEEGVETGYAAMGHQTRDPQNTIVSVKRLMGRGLADLSDARRFPYRFVDAPGMVKIGTRAGVKSPIEISADLLRALRERAEASARRGHRRRRGHGAGLFRRCAAPGDQGCGATRGPPRSCAC